MDFLHIFRTIEGLLYEIMGWLVFYPRTLWRSIRHPAEMMRYSEAEQTEQAEQQYSDSLSPPLFLLLSILIAHAIEVAMHREDRPARRPRRRTGQITRVSADAESDRIFDRAVDVRRRTAQAARTADRPREAAWPLLQPVLCGRSLRAGIRAVVGGDAFAHPSAADRGGVAATAAVGWYLWLQTRWLSTHLDISTGRSVLIALWTAPEGHRNHRRNRTGADLLKASRLFTRLFSAVS